MMRQEIKESGILTWQLSSSSLQDNTKCENATSGNERQSTTNSIGNWRGAQGSEKCASGEDRDNFGRL